MKLVAGVAFALSAAGGSKPAHAAQVHEIRIGSEENPEELVFEPETITINSGDSVRWMKNPGLTQHNVVFAQEDVPTGVDAAKLSMDPKQRLKKAYFARTFTEKGEYTYKCIPHCTVMSGRITVV